MKNLDTTSNINLNLETLEKFHQMLIQTNADKSFVSIIESEIEDLQNEKSLTIQDQKHFVKSLYKGKSEVDDQIALEGKLEEFDFVEDSEE